MRAQRSEDGFLVMTTFQQPRLFNRPILLGCLVAAFLLPRTRAAAPNEYAVKARFLYHFAGFVTWPSAAFATDHAPLVIGVVGGDPFGHYLDDAVAGETLLGRPLAIARFPRARDVTACHILFVGYLPDPEIDDLLGRLRGQPVLTVGESEDFARRGGVIRFLTYNNRTRFRINLTAARDAGLVISSQLLRAADVIAPGKGRS